jgi:hypothetical protein
MPKIGMLQNQFNPPPPVGCWVLSSTHQRTSRYCFPFLMPLCSVIFTEQCCVDWTSRTYQARKTTLYLPRITFTFVQSVNRFGTYHCLPIIIIIVVPQIFTTAPSFISRSTLLLATNGHYTRIFTTTPPCYCTIIFFTSLGCALPHFTHFR